MLNLSQQILSSPEIPVFEKLKFLWLPEIYLAEDVRDIQDSMYKIKHPLYKKILSRRVEWRAGCDTGRTSETFFVVLYNVGIKAIQDPDCRVDCLGRDCREFIVPPSLFTIRDKSGVVFANWNRIFRAYLSFEKAQEVEGLKECDFVHRIIFRLSIKHFPSLHVYDLTKTELSRTVIDCAPELSRVKLLIPRLIPAPGLV